MSIAENVALIKARIREAAIAAGRDPSAILLCAATKMNDSAAVRQAIAAGVDLCGENRVQELTQKSAENAYEGVPVHFIGHLQTNKVKKVVGKADVIQSVDSIRLLEAIDKEAAKQGLRQDVLLELNIGEELTKTGAAAEDLWPMLERAAGLQNVFVRGLMAIPPAFDNGPESRRYFAMLRELMEKARARKYENADLEMLSMGMSGSYEAAILEGATLVRVGTAIYGQRDYPNRV